MRALVIMIASCALAACYHPSVAENVPCGPGDACPTGLVCDRGLCVSTPRPDDAAVDAFIVDAARPDAPPDAYIPKCATNVLLTDNLDDTTAAPAFAAGTSGTGITITEGSGHLDIVFAASVAATSYGFYTSTTTYAADGLCAAVEVSQVPSNGGLAYLKLRSGTFELEFLEENGTLYLRTRDPTLVTRKMFAFNLAAHRFWRLRQQGGTTYWDTAPDGVAYVEQYSIAGVFTPTSASIDFGAGAPVDVSNGGTARFESVTARGP